MYVKELAALLVIKNKKKKPIYTIRSYLFLFFYPLKV